MPNKDLRNSSSSSSSSSSSNKRYRILKTGTIVFLIILLGASLLISLNSEFRSFILFKFLPVYARNSHFIKLTNDNQEVYLLGTIHKDHLKTKDYSLLHIEAVIDHLKPDFVLVEIKPEEVEKDNLGSGPIEMLFASLVARSEGIKVDGFDWWILESGKPGTSYPDRDQRMFENVLKRLPGHKRVLVLTGYSHMLDFSPALQKNGYTLASFPKEQKDALFGTTGMKLIFPKGMSYYLEKQIGIYHIELSNVTDKNWRAAIEEAIKNSKELIKIIKSGEQDR